MKRKLNKNEVITILEDDQGQEVHNDEEKSSILKDYFFSVFSILPNEHAAKNKTKLNIPIYQEKNDVDLHPMHVKGALNRMKYNSSPMPDGILPKDLMREELVRPMIIIFNKKHGHIRDSPGLKRRKCCSHFQEKGQ